MEGMDTFDSSLHPRLDDGTFTAKPQSAPDVQLAALMSAGSETHAVAFLRASAPEGIASVNLEWSDSGDFLELISFRMKNGTLLDAEGFYDDPQTDEESPLDAPGSALFDQLADAATLIERPEEHGLEPAPGNPDRYVLQLDRA